MNKLLNKEKIDRINELAKKQKKEGLTKEKQVEQKNLREAYLKAFRSQFKQQLESIEIVDDKKIQ